MRATITPSTTAAPPRLFTTAELSERSSGELFRRAGHGVDIVYTHAVIVGTTPIFIGAYGEFKDARHAGIVDNARWVADGTIASVAFTRNTA